MDKNSTKTVFKKYIDPIEERIFSKMVSHLELDKYVKKLSTLRFAKLFIFAQIQQFQSLQDISLEVKHNKGLQRELGLNSISASQLLRKLRNIPPCIFQAILNHLIQRVRQTFGVREANQILEKIHLIDSSTITLCLRQYPWGP
jgi:hypothetical protein